MATELKIRDDFAGTPGRRPAEEDVDQIRCGECGTTYPAVDGPALLYSLKAPCLRCGGDCELVVIDATLSDVA